MREKARPRSKPRPQAEGARRLAALRQFGNRTSLTFGNGAVESYGYDAVSRLVSLTNNLGGTANDLTATFAYNPASQIGSTTRTGDAYAWTGHRNENTASVANGLNQLTGIGGAATAHDARGNLTSDPTSGKTYAYDSENRLKSASGGVSVYYDPLGRMSEYDTTVSSRFMHDGPEVAVEVDNPTSVTTRRYVRGDNPDELLVWYEGSGTADRRFASTDERGSVISLTGSSGALIGINSYDEYGVPGASNLGRFGYTGQKWLSELAAYDYKARLYSAALGRFLQTDPVGYAGGPNLYAYVLNDPVNLVDPLGLEDLAITVSACRYGGTLGHCNGPPQPNYFGGNIVSDTIGVPGTRGKLPPPQTVITAPQKEQTRKISPCMQKFLASKGLGGSNLGSVVFHNGDGGSLIASAAFALGNPAITIQNNVYVAPGHWNSFREGTSGFFEETVHSMQWAESGAGNFVFAWALGSVAGKIATWDAHNSPLEAQAMGMSVNLAKAYSEAGAQCGRGG